MKERYQILVLYDMKQKFADRLRQIFEGHQMTFTNNKDVTIEQLETCNIIIGNPKRMHLSYVKNLKWVQLNSAGSDKYMQENFPEDCLLSNATGSYGLAISEHMIGVILMLMKKFDLYYQHQLQHEWKEAGEIKSIYGSTFLVLGPGDIGGTFAKKIKELGGYVIAIKAHLDEKPSYIDELYTTERLDEVISRADVITMSLPNNASTYHVLNEERIAKLKKDAIVVNVGRGPAIDLDALTKALQEEKIGGVALDVFDPEPLDPNHPLWDTSRAIITPHISGRFNLDETEERYLNIVEENVTRFMNKQSLINEVDFKTGYRKYIAK